MIATMCTGSCNCCTTTCDCTRALHDTSWDYIVTVAHQSLDQTMLYMIEDFYKLFHYFRPIIIWLVFKLQSISDKLIPRQKDYG